MFVPSNGAVNLIMERFEVGDLGRYTFLSSAKGNVD